MENSAQSTDERVTSNGAEVMDTHGSRNCCTIMDMDVAAEHRSVGNDHVAADFAIVSDVNASHEVAVASDGCNSIFFFSRSVDRDTFTNHVVVTDDDSSRSPFVANVLGLTANHGEGMDVIVLTDRTMSLDRDVVLDFASIANSYVRAYYAEWSDFNIVTNFRAGIDTSQVRDVRCHTS